MKVIYDPKFNQKLSRPVVAVGVFDGVHLGHRYLIRQVVKKARQIGGTSVVMTFFPHPLHVLCPRIALPFIVSLEHRLKLIEQLGVDICLVVKFTKEFSRLSAPGFIKKYFVKKLKPKFIFVGSDFRFGKGREGDMDFLRKAGQDFGFKVRTVTFVKRMGNIISSTKIRKAVAKGSIGQVSRLLGRPVSLFGKVSYGSSRGKAIGFPTANINLESRLVVPLGVYAVQVRVNRKLFYGMANVGLRPSFDDGEGRRAEVHIFDFDRTIYGKKIEIYFLSKIRKEKKFPSPQALIGQLRKDEIAARNLIRKHSSKPQK